MKFIFGAVCLLGILFKFGDPCQLVSDYIECVWNKYKNNENQTDIGVLLCGIEAFPKCLKSINWSKMNKCFKVSQVFQVDNNVNMVKNAAQYLCKNNGAIVKSFKENGGRKCLDDLEQELNHCNASEVFTIHTKNTESCSSKKNASICAAEAIQGKCSATIYNITAGLYEVIFKASPCGTGALQFSVVLIVLSVVSGLIWPVKM